MNDKTTVKHLQHAAGAPASVGGQFKLNPKRESVDGLLSAGRLAALRSDVDVEAAAVPRGDYAEHDIATWWDREFTSAEHGAVAKMPDDYTPSMTGGRALTGNRRTHRKSYKGAGVDIRMPSATSIRAYAKENGNKTFDIPISADYPGGDVQGWLRVTRKGPGEWSVSGLGMSEKASAYVSEAASAVLEARAPSVALGGVQDLMVRRQKRFDQGGVRMDTTKKSGFIAGVGYDRASGILFVKMAGKKTYQYKATIATYNMVRNAVSPGTVYNALKRSRAGRGDDVISCEKCGRCSAASVGHRCPSAHDSAAEGATFPQNSAMRKAAARRFGSAKVLTPTS